LAADESKADEDDVRIYPISSEGGYVIYHVGSTVSKQFMEDSQSHDVFMSRTVDVRDDIVTKNHLDALSIDFPIDVFGSQASLDKKLALCGKTAESSTAAFNNVRRHSDDASVENCVGDSDFVCHVSNSAESIVDAVISEVIDNVVTSCFNVENGVDQVANGQLSNGLDYEGEVPSEMHCDGVDYTSDQSSAIARTSAGDVSPVMHPLYAHILLYVRKFDTNRALYALSRLRAIIATSANVIVRSLTTSNVGGTSTPRALLLQSLLVQHRRSVLGKRFCTDDTESSASGIRSSMYIDVLVTICLYYVRGYYPNLLAPSLVTLDIADNARLQVTAADILSTVLDELAVITRTGGRGFATYIFDLLDKCKVSWLCIEVFALRVHNKCTYCLRCGC